MTKSRSVLVRMSDDSGKSYREMTTLIYCSITVFLDNRAVYGIMWKILLQPDRPQMTIMFMRTACWIARSTNTQPEYVLFTAFPL